MGTRGITKVIYNGEPVISQYGQWDHYPEYTGKVALEFLQGKGNIERLTQNLKNIEYLTDEQLEVIQKPYVNDKGWMTMESGDKYKEAYPSLTRDTGVGILQLVADATDTIPIVRDLEFEKEDGWCEGVYTIDLDNRQFISEYGGAKVIVYFDDLDKWTNNKYQGVFSEFLELQNA